MARAHDSVTPRLTAFVGRSFLPSDKAVWQDLRDILDGLKPLGFEYEDAKEAQPRPVSTKVRELIVRNDVYIGLLTKRLAVYEQPQGLAARCQFAFGVNEPKRWSTSEWVVEEIGFALGKDRPVILLVEEGVVFPTSDLDADTEWIAFSRANLSASQTGITQMISNLIAKRVQTVPQAPAASAAPTEPEIPNDAKITFPDQLKILKESAESQDLAKADEVQAEILGEEKEAEARSLIESFLWGYRARAGDTVALDRLTARCAQDPPDVDALFSLGSVYSSFQQYDKAAGFFLSQLQRVSEADKTTMAIKASQALRKDKKGSDAIELLLRRILSEADEQGLVSLYREVAHAAEDLKDADLEAAFLEKLLAVHPMDNNARFRLAYNYSDANRDTLAAHHYAILTAHVDWPWALNNLGATYASLDLKAAQVDQYEKASVRYALSKANLASIYADAGLLKIADDLARAALAATDDLTGQDRGRYVLSEITKLRKKEEDAIANIPQNTKPERSFMTAYAEASYASRLSVLAGSYMTQHGELSVTLDGAKLRGTGTVTEEVSRGLGLAALALMGTPGQTRTEPTVRTLTLALEGNVRGRAGTFKLRVTSDQEKRAATILSDTGRTIEGLLIISEDGSSIRLLEREGKETRIVTATRK